MENKLKKKKRIKFTFINTFRIAISGAATLHLLFLIIFIIKGVTPLIIFNIFSVMLLIFFSTYYIKRNPVLSTIISFIEVSSQTLVCTYYIGWDSGFYVYPLCMVPIIYFVSISILKKDSYGHIAVLMTFLIYQLSKIFADSRIAEYQEAFLPINEMLYKFNTLNASFIFAFLMYAFLSEMRDTQEALEDRNQVLNNIANIDMLTGIYNRRYMTNKLIQEVEKFKKDKKVFSIAICDIDDFKKINDTYGHDCGDIFLKEIANILKTAKNKYDIEICRWGGEEFLILSKNNLYDTKEICEIILKQVRSYSLVYNEKVLKATMTIGISEFDMNNNDIEKVLKIADVNLYKGKAGNKDCIVI